jgi:hypothetical protein
MASLHFQLVQERNERRLLEYRLKQPPSACSCHSAAPQTDVQYLLIPHHNFSCLVRLCA